MMETSFMNIILRDISYINYINLILINHIYINLYTRSYNIDYNAKISNFKSLKAVEF